jgi:hypothetical protein
MSFSKLVVVALVVFSLAPSAAADVAVQVADPADYGMTAGRLAASVGALLGLVGLVVGAVSLRSSGRIGTGFRRRGALLALVTGPIGMALGGLVVASADGGIGTGNGLGGGIVAIALGLVGVVIGRLALVRSRRAG